MSPNSRRFCMNVVVTFTSSLLAVACWNTAQAQFGGGMGGMTPKIQKATVSSPDETPPNTETAKAATELLDEVVSFGKVQVEVGNLEAFLQEQLDGVGVFVDQRAVAKAKVKPSTPISITIPDMPLRAALRKMLRPVGLKATVQAEGIAIGADFRELARREIATEMSIESETESKIRDQLFQSVSLTAVEEPLADVIQRLSDETEIPMIINRRALEEIGLTPDQPVSVELKNVRLQSLLRIILRDLDLTYRMDNDVLELTTLEHAEQNLMVRIYYLEGLGIKDNDATSVVKLIHATVVPDCWDLLGGPSTIQPFLPGTGNRPSLVIDATMDVHQQISELLTAIRKSHL